MDIVGIDAYNEYGVDEERQDQHDDDRAEDALAKVAPWAAAHHVKWAVAETGYTNLAADKDAGWLTRAYDDMKAYGGIGLAYFDSALNPIGDSTWTIDTAPKVEAFKAVLARSSRW